MVAALLLSYHLDIPQVRNIPQDVFAQGNDPGPPVEILSIVIRSKS